jgi:hypothetical protein
MLSAMLQMPAFEVCLQKQDPKPKLMGPIRAQLGQCTQNGTSVAPCTAELSMNTGVWLC